MATYFIHQHEGWLAGDQLLDDLFKAGFVVKLFEADGDSNAGLEDRSGEGRVPEPDLMWRFAERQPQYAKELKLRQPLLNKGRRKPRI
jgi:hypothetical protein